VFPSVGNNVPAEFYTLEKKSTEALLVTSYEGWSSIICWKN